MIISLIINLAFLLFLVSYSVEVAEHNDKVSKHTLESMDAFSQKLQAYLDADSHSDRIAVADDLHHAYGRILYGRSGIINIHVPFFFGDKAYYNTIRALDNHVFATLYLSYTMDRRETGEEFNDEEKVFISAVLLKLQQFHEVITNNDIQDYKTRREIVIEGIQIVNLVRKSR